MSNSTNIDPEVGGSTTCNIPEVHVEQASSPRQTFGNISESLAPSRQGSSRRSQRLATSSGPQFSDDFEGRSRQHFRHHSRQGSRQHSRDGSWQGSRQNAHEHFNPFDPLQRLRLAPRSHSHSDTQELVSGVRSPVQWARSNSYNGHPTILKQSRFKEFSEATALSYENSITSSASGLQDSEKEFFEKDPKLFTTGYKEDPRLKWGPQPYFRSRRIKKGTIERPELKEKDPHDKWVNIIPYMGVIVGLGVIGLLTWVGLHSVINHKYCSVLYDDFSHGFNPRVWTQEVQCGGYG